MTDKYVTRELDLDSLQGKKLMRFAYADPPYIGQAMRHYKNDPSGIPAAEVNHEDLVGKLMTYDGWALSCHVPSLGYLLSIVPKETRVMAWVKPFVPFRGQCVAYAWEPLLVYGARSKQKGERPLTVRDWVEVSPPIFTKKAIGTTKGQKPKEFCWWLFSVLGLQDGDSFEDMFPGSGAVTQALSEWIDSGRVPYIGGCSKAKRPLPHGKDARRRDFERLALKIVEAIAKEWEPYAPAAEIGARNTAEKLLFRWGQACQALMEGGSK